MSDVEECYQLFKVADQNFATSNDLFVESISNPIITECPGVEGYIAGVTNFYGKILPVVDLFKRLNISSSYDYNIAMVVEIKENLVGILAEEVGAKVLVDKLV